MARQKIEANAFAEFWRQLPAGKKVHPADKPILDAEKHSLTTSYFPAFGEGALAAAPVDLCYLNHRPPKGPAIRVTRDHERRPGANWGEYLAGVIEGKSEPRPLSEWTKKRIEGLKPEVATFNIVPYRSPTFKDARLTQFLPSVRMARNYLHSVLLPAATRNERFIAVIWGARLWSVHPTQSHATLKVETGNRGGWLSDNLKAQIEAWASRRGKT